MGSSTSKESGTHRLKSRILSSSCFSIAPTQGGEEEIESKKNHNDEDFKSGASSSNPNPIRKNKTRFRFGSKLTTTLSLGSVQNNESIENNVAIESNINTTHENVINNNENDNNVSGDEELRRNGRRVNAQELPLENSVRFSRTLSVGRLRDRVLRRSSSNNAGIFGIEERNGGEHNAQISERRVLSGGGNRRGVHNLGNEVWPEYLRRNGYGGGAGAGGFESENAVMQLRDRSGHELLEHRSAFLERRRRIRSQVRALQRLGSRFENLSGHERSCILSGHHRTGRCTCRASNRVVGANDDNTGTRANLSRIVMLAEALFEVLDEIHQQSVALTSRPSFSSIGSVPAPKEIVECMPVKIYQRPQKHQNEEAAQCYVCLVEYEEGDSMRILPCNHEFHRTCIDKWLKEIHRVCPLCRGDVCKSGADKIT